jgi:hypothetical protein
VAENDGLDVEKKSHSGLLTIMELLVTYRRGFADLQPIKNDSPCLTIQGQNLPTQHVGITDDT